MNGVEKRAHLKMKRSVRARTIFAKAQYSGDYLESKLDYIARMIINDVVSEGKVFRDAYVDTCSFFGLASDEQIGLQHALLRHGWCSAYNSVGAPAPDRFNVINPYYIAPIEQYNF